MASPVCPLCGHKVPLNGQGQMRRHSPLRNWREVPWCPASQRTVKEAEAMLVHDEDCFEKILTWGDCQHTRGGQ